MRFICEIHQAADTHFSIGTLRFNKKIGIKEERAFKAEETA